MQRGLGSWSFLEAQKGKKLGDTASDIMTSPAITALEDTSMKELIRSIADRKIKRIIIVDGKGHPVGIVSRVDILRTLDNIKLDSLKEGKD